jgi:uncharacterized surface protein with fasciclin (FAS1) repeats
MVKRPNLKIRKGVSVMKIINVFLIAALAVTLPVGIMAGSHGSKTTAQMDIVDTAVAARSFDTLVAALKAADLVDVLRGDGPFTVFAPTDDAFAKLPEGTVENLLKPENKEKLQAVLTYHVVAGRYMAADILAMSSAKTVNGQSFTISTHQGKAMVDNAQIIKTDIETSNGVIHVVDTVILPKDM